MIRNACTALDGRHHAVANSRERSHPRSDASGYVPSGRSVLQALALMASIVGIVLITAGPALADAETPTAACGLRRDCDKLVTIQVPSAAFRTIQSAIDAAPDGATILIAPGRYRETLFVQGKRLRIIGSDKHAAPRLVGDPVREIVTARDAVGLINYGRGGGGQLQYLRFEGAEAAVVGRGTDVEIRDVQVAGGGRGILWDSAWTLTLKGVTIRQTVGNGLSILQGSLLSSNFDVINAKMVGIYIANAHVVLDNPSVGFNHSAGIFAVNSFLGITGGSVSDNAVAGIWAVHSVLSVSSTSFYSNHSLAPTNSFGDGMTLVLSTADLTDIDSISNDRCGLYNLGSTSTVIGATLQSNIFALCGEVLPPNALGPGDPVQEATFHFEDGGGNYCTNQGGQAVTCQVESPGIQPPEALPNP